ncbi:AP2-like ethylene-responsive transcription factor AIL5 [Cryptomeria japonica]|uniref:AP2-like ethylene-responsive transcription factor AIL5 n=1 Tax=Cryptomeria japonica TaxID=3369 RepID=UPI0025AC8AB9|nr:AP2-like ethylene-responsive transcription factor AIL5 [Cryptomeria japonica]
MGSSAYQNQVNLEGCFCMFNALRQNLRDFFDGLLLRMLYLGVYEHEESAARAYDLAALRCCGPAALTNFPINTYERELEEMKNMSKEGYIEFLRRSSTGFSMRKSPYRGVTRSLRDGRWQARLGGVDGKYLYLGTFTNQEEAAEAYDIAAIKFKGENAITNFDRNRYDMEAIMEYTPPVGRRVELEDKESNGGFQTTTINVESTGNVPSCTDCTAPTAINGHAPALENILSLGTSTFCFPGQSSGVVRAGHENVMPDTNWKTPSLPVSESGLSVTEAACQRPIMFNIWNDTRMSKS